MNWLWFWIAAMVISLVVMIEAFIMRAHKGSKDKLNILYSVHRIFIQRKKLRSEDVIVFSLLSFVLTGIYVLLMTNFSFSFNKAADAQVQLKPNVAAKIIQGAEKRGDPIEILEVEDTEGGAGIAEANANGEYYTSQTVKDQKLIVVGEPIRRYEEHVFDVVPARISDTIQWEAENFMRPVGQVFEDTAANGGVAVRALKSSDVVGYMAVSDPTTLQKAGEYKVHYKVKSANAQTTDSVLRLEIWDEHENIKLFEQTIKGADFKKSNEYQYFDGTYIREKKGSTQVKMYYPGVSDIAFDHIEILPLAIDATEYDPAQFYMDLPEPMASGAIVRLAQFEKDIPGRIAFGPYDDSVGAGYYRASFRLKVKENTRAEKIALVDVSSNAEGFESAYRTILPTDFANAGEYQEFTLDFYKPEAGFIEFRVYYYGVSDLYFDRVDLYKLREI